MGDRTPTPRDVRDRRIHEALGLVWLFTGRIVVNDDGVSWVHSTLTEPRKLPAHTTRVSVEGVPWATYLTRTYLSMTGAQRRAIQRAEREYQDTVNPNPFPTRSERILEALVYPWLIPLAYRVARVWDHLKEWWMVYFANSMAGFWLLAITIEGATRG